MPTALHRLAFAIPLMPAALNAQPRKSDPHDYVILRGA